MVIHSPTLCSFGRLATSSRWFLSFHAFSPFLVRLRRLLDTARSHMWALCLQYLSLIIRRLLLLIAGTSVAAPVTILDERVILIALMGLICGDSVWFSLFLLFWMLIIPIITLLWHNWSNLIPISWIFRIFSSFGALSTLLWLLRDASVG